VQIPRNARSLSDPFFQPKLIDSACDRPAEDSGDGKGENRDCWDDYQDSALHTLHICYSLQHLSADLLIDTVNQNRGLGFKRL